jgi:hypothetical protein
MFIVVVASDGRQFSVDQSGLGRAHVDPHSAHDVDPGIDVNDSSGHSSGRRGGQEGRHGAHVVDVDELTQWRSLPGLLDQLVELRYHSLGITNAISPDAGLQPLPRTVRHQEAAGHDKRRPARAVATWVSDVRRRMAEEDAVDV